MKTIVVALSFLYSFSNDPIKSSISLLPEGLELGKTLRTEMDPEVLNAAGPVFASNFDAHFNQRGFLKKVVIDREKGHVLPASKGISWDITIEELTEGLSHLENLKITKRDVSKSPTVSSLMDVYFTHNNTTCHFYFVQWKDDNRADGLISVSISNY